jgi:hypothetical protein
VRQRLAAGLLPRGAKVLPGPFVASLTGRSGRTPLLFQLRTVTLPAPPEGVVRSSFASATEGGRPAPALPPTLIQAWAQFVFAAQPRAGRKVTIAWHFPDGKRIGTVAKANRPKVTSFLRSERYARGEISADEYKERLANLK